MVLEFYYGNAVTGKADTSAPDLEARLMRVLGNSDGIKMFGLRRIGKSTLRLFAMESLQQDGVPVAFVDAQGLRSHSDLLASSSASCQMTAA